MIKYYKTQKCHGVHTKFNENSVGSRFICGVQNQRSTTITIIHAGQSGVPLTLYSWMWRY
jgi:hypothetical protein